jgi:hypothetical protein
MNVSLALSEFGPGAHVYLSADDESSSVLNLSRRMSSARTLDGGIAVTDFGYFDASRLLEFKFLNASRAQAETISTLIKSGARLTVSFYDGCYECVVQRGNVDRDRVELFLTVVRRRDA